MTGRTKKGDLSRYIILKTIHDYTEQHHRSISYRELSEITGYKSTATIFRHVGALQGLGYLRKHNQGEPRSFVVTYTGLQAIEKGSLY